MNLQDLVKEVQSCRYRVCSTHGATAEDTAKINEVNRTLDRMERMLKQIQGVELQ